MTTDTPRPPMVSVCRRRAGALPERAGSRRPSRPNFRPAWRSAAWRLHPTKTKIVYCKDGKRQGRYPNVTFDFLGYRFRPRAGQKFSEQRIVLRLHPRGQPLGAESHAVDGPGLEHPATDAAARWTTSPRKLNPLLRGWIGYYGRYTPCGAGAHAPTRQSDAAWAGRCGSLSAFRGARLRPARFLEKLARNRRHPLRYIGVSE